ncbi:hypothetical protein B0O80DRAFT_435060 [Mortierella sp. GBAus27b]|nr:hypothetical protein B0O80DRAFT_435060 [Mortierella sp. GBAus27b]
MFAFVPLIEYQAGRVSRPFLDMIFAVNSVIERPLVEPINMIPAISLSHHDRWTGSTYPLHSLNDGVSWLVRRIAQGMVLKQLVQKSRAALFYVRSGG